MDPMTMGLGMAGGGMIGQMVTGFMGIQDQKKVMEAQQRFQDIQAQRERLQQVRQARVQSANIQQAGANAGVGSSSSVQGGAGSVMSQASSNIQFINSTQAVSQQITSARENVVQDQGMSDLFKGISDLGQSAMAAPPGLF